MTAAHPAKGTPRVAFTASDAEAAQLAFAELRQLYGTVEPEAAVREPERVVDLHHQ